MRQPAQQQQRGDMAGRGPAAGQGGPQQPSVGMGAAPRPPPCGSWFSTLFGQCCIHPQENVEGELRENPQVRNSAAAAASQQQQQQQQLQQQLQQQSQYRPQAGHAQGFGAGTGLHGEFQGTGAGGAAAGARAGAAANSPAAASRGASAANSPPQVSQPGSSPGSPITGTFSSQDDKPYLIDNSVLRAVGPPGVAYRYSKNKNEKVGNEVKTKVAKWGEIVRGVDQGDGWLKVGDYFLPMVHDNISVITPVDQGTGKPKQKRPPSTTPPAPAAADSNGAAVQPQLQPQASPLPPPQAVQKQQPQQLQSQPQSQPPVPPPPPQQTLPHSPTGAAKAQTPAVGAPSGPTPAAAAPSPPATAPAPAPAPAADAAAAAGDSATVTFGPRPVSEPSAGAPSPVKDDVPAVPQWRLRPSVGTWLHPAPAVAKPIEVLPCKPKAMEQANGAAATLLSDSCSAAACFEEPQKPAAVACPAEPMDKVGADVLQPSTPVAPFRLKPSVGTWLQMPVKSSMRPGFSVNGA